MRDTTQIGDLIVGFDSEDDGFITIRKKYGTDQIVLTGFEWCRLEAYIKKQINAIPPDTTED